jgi:hypothetical protein
MGAGIGFFALSQSLGGAFVIFVMYEAVALLLALATYTQLAIRGGMPGAGLLAAGVALSLIAAVIQVSGLKMRLIVRFDHNGLFHLVQMVAVLVIGLGLRASLGPR